MLKVYKASGVVYARFAGVPLFEVPSIQLVTGHSQFDAGCRMALDPAFIPLDRYDNMERVGYAEKEDIIKPRKIPKPKKEFRKKLDIYEEEETKTRKNGRIHFAF